MGKRTSSTSSGGGSCVDELCAGFSVLPCRADPPAHRLSAGCCSVRGCISPYGMHQGTRCPVSLHPNGKHALHLISAARQASVSFAATCRQLQRPADIKATAAVMQQGAWHTASMRWCTQCTACPAPASSPVPGAGPGRGGPTGACGELPGPSGGPAGVMSGPWGPWPEGAVCSWLPPLPRPCRLPSEPRECILLLSGSPKLLPASRVSARWQQSATAVQRPGLACCSAISHVRHACEGLP